MDGVIENTSTDKIMMIDKLCKRILGHPEVLGRIMKDFIKEAENLSLEEIMELIKGKKDHDIENKYDRVDWVLTPLVVFFNNTLDLLGKKNIEHVRNLMNELPCSMQRAMNILKLTTYERKKLKNIFIHKRKNVQITRSFLY